MAAGDFTAANYLNVLAAMADIQSTSTLDVEKDAPVTPLKRVCERQKVTLRGQSNEILTGGKCQTVKAFHTVVGSHLLVHSRSDANTAQGCNLATGSRLQAVGKDYNTNFNIKSAFQVNSDDCANASDFNEKIAKGLMAAMATNRRDLQANHFYPLLNSNAQINEANSNIFTEFSDQGTGNRVKVAPANWDFELALKIRQFGEQNRLGEFIAISGSNLYYDKHIAEYRKLNDDKRDQSAIFSDLEMVWDTYDLDTKIGTPATFLLSLSAPCIWNSSWWSDMPVEKDTNTYHYRVQDPVLSWNNNGTLVPFYHHIETKYQCVSRNSMDDSVYAHTFNVTLIGGMHRAPDGFNWPLDTATAPTQTRTGIMAIYNEA